MKYTDEGIKIEGVKASDVTPLLEEVDAEATVKNTDYGVFVRYTSESEVQRQMVQLAVECLEEPVL